MKTFTTLKGIATHQQEIKKSVFIAYAARAESQENAMAFLREVLTRHPDASHLCWAYRIGGQYRFSDGGEPGGTAGQPILRAIEGQDLDHVIVGVVRYWGGIKLGAGGLMRAYGGTAAEALRTAEKQVESPQVLIIVETGFEHISALYRALDACSAEDRVEDYHEQGVRMTAKLPANELDRFLNQLRDGTKGQFQLIAPGRGIGH
jgi:uncharacterized YigZ family protein